MWDIGRILDVFCLTAGEIIRKEVAEKLPTVQLASWMLPSLCEATASKIRIFSITKLAVEFSHEMSKEGCGIFLPPVAHGEIQQSLRQHCIYWCMWVVPRVQKLSQVFPGSVLFPMCKVQLNRMIFQALSTQEVGNLATESSPDLKNGRQMEEVGTGKARKAQRMSGGMKC